MPSDPAGEGEAPTTNQSIDHMPWLSSCMWVVERLPSGDAAGIILVWQGFTSELRGEREVTTRGKWKALVTGDETNCGQNERVKPKPPKLNNKVHQPPALESGGDLL